ncbi:MAG TPA: hypothetical protein VJ804_06110 [Acidimicrobiales bacterium]|nr:hypothetical protein [Acidimicrobiales bacterium]
MTWLRSVLVSAVLVVVATVTPVPATPASAAPGWAYVLLDPLPGKEAAVFRDANEVGAAVGWSGTLLLAGADAVPTAWDRDGNAYPLGMPTGYLNAIPYAVNDHGVAVGVGVRETNGSLVHDSLVWRPGQAVQVLTGADGFGVPVEVLDTEPPRVVNLAGEVHVVGGPQVTLPANGGQVVARDARLLDGQGAVVGHQVTTEHGTRAALWTDAGMALLAPDWPFDTTAADVAGFLAAVNYALGDGGLTGCSAAALHIGATVVPLDPAADTSIVQDVTSYGIAVGTRTAEGCGASEGVVWVYGTVVPLRTLVGLPQDLQAAEVTEQLHIYGANFLIRPA